MQLNNLQLFLGTLDLLTLLVAIFVCLAMTILKKVLKERLKTSITVYLPTILAIAIHFTVKCISDGFFVALSVETVYNGLISGSVSTVITVIISKLLGGKPIPSPKTMILEGILKEIIHTDHIQIVTEKILLVVNQDLDEQTKTLKVSEIIFNYTNLEMDDEQRKTLSLFIINSVSSIKK